MAQGLLMQSLRLAYIYVYHFSVTGVTGVTALIYNNLTVTKPVTSFKNALQGALHA